MVSQFNSLPDLYDRLYPETQENKTIFCIPSELKLYKNKIIHDYEIGLEKVDSIAKEIFGVGAHEPKKYTIGGIPLIIEYNGKIGVIAGAYDPENDTVILNFAYYGYFCNPPLLDLNKGKIKYVSGCYKLSGEPSETIAHELTHALLDELSYNKTKNEIATRKLVGS